MYCGTALESSTPEQTLDVHVLENWQKGFNVVVVGSDRAEAGPAATLLSSVIGGDAEIFESIINSGKPLPVARLESEDHAWILAAKLAAHGVKATVVSDLELAPTTPPLRVRGLEFDSDELVLHPFGGGIRARVHRDDVAVIIAGLVCESKTESIEKRKRKATTTVSEIKMSSDETVIDIYSTADETGWRIPMSGFDFSCLGSDKSLLAADNMERLLARLEDFAPNAEVVVDYPSVRSMLEQCWPSESRKDGLGFKRSGFGRKDLSSVFTTNNSLQLLKYSRLRRHLYEKETA
jgi:hypothetical protein